MPRIPSGPSTSTSPTSIPLPTKKRKCRPEDQVTAGEKLLQLRRSGKDRPKTCHSTKPQSGFKRPSTRPTSCIKCLNSAPVTVVRTPGYTLSRFPTSVHMSINTAAFFGEKEKISASDDSQMVVKELTAELEKMRTAYQELQAELAATKIKMEEMKKDHKKLIDELQRVFKEEKDAMWIEHKLELEECKTSHQNKIKNIKISHKQMIESMAEAQAVEEAKLKADKEIAEELLAKTKVVFREESDEKLQKLEYDLKRRHDSDIVRLQRFMHKETIDELDSIKKVLMQQHTEEIEELKEEHKKEVDALLTQFTHVPQLEEEAVRNKKQMKKLEKQASRLKLEIKSAQSKQIDTEVKLLETQTELEKTLAEFNDKVTEIESKFKSRIDDLVLENSQLRKKFLNKSEELCEYRLNIESNNSKIFQNYREKVYMMIKAKERISVPTGLSEEDVSASMSRRPSSAPSTRKESLNAQKYVLCSKPNKKQQEEKLRTSFRPKFNFFGVQ